MCVFRGKYLYVYKNMYLYCFLKKYFDSIGVDESMFGPPPNLSMHPHQPPPAHVLFFAIRRGRRLPSNYTRRP
jgi:hypothetical protein